MRGSLLARALAAALGSVVVTFIALVAAGDADWGQRDLAALAVAAVVTGAGTVMVFFAPHRSMNAVSQTARDLSEGRMDRRVSVTSGTTSRLTRNFNQMAARMQLLFTSTEADRARLEAVLDASTDAMIALARDTTVRFLNAAALRVLRVGYESAINRPFIESVRDYELDALVRRVTARTGPETAVITFGPQRTPLRAVGVPIRDGGDWAVLLILVDLTEVQRLEQVRRDFLSNVSHELRTPLASIRALVETIEAEPNGSSGRDEFTGRILQQVDRLTALVNELLDLSRIESGAIELKPEEFQLVEVVAEAVGLQQPRLAATGVSVEWPEGCELRVEADRASVLRVVSNLLDNAVKYSPAGSTVHVDVRDEGELAALSIRDEGPGIPPGDLPRVFERFYKGDASRAEPGVGLGLAIVKHLVRAHGGTAEVASRPGAGAEFTVRFPAKFVGSRRAVLQ
ncbi:MAG TPA: ATP-binding protein [Tepidiformaceae bacterium]